MICRRYFGMLSTEVGLIRAYGSAPCSVRLRSKTFSLCLNFFDVGDVPYCPCGGLIRPDVVFFGEGLPPRFVDMRNIDMKQCDLLIVMGTRY